MFDTKVMYILHNVMFSLHFVVNTLLNIYKGLNIKKIRPLTKT